MGFRQRLKERQEKTKSLVGVGLDPLLGKIPPIVRCTWGHLISDSNAVLFWMQGIIDAVADYMCMFKLQSAHYEALRHGRETLQSLVDYIHYKHPGIPVFLDCKRGDIGRTQQRYRDAHFYLDKVDGMNFNPYMGKDCMEALVNPLTLGKAIVGLCYTSNPAAREMQDVTVAKGLQGVSSYWEFVTEKILKWATELGVVENAGLVMAAAYLKDGESYSHHLRRAREIVGDKLWFLIPGIGTQRGFIEETVEAAYQGYGSMVISSSSAVIFASSEPDFAEAARAEVEELQGRAYHCINS